MRKVWYVTLLLVMISKNSIAGIEKIIKEELYVLHYVSHGGADSTMLKEAFETFNENVPVETGVRQKFLLMDLLGAILEYNKGRDEVVFNRLLKLNQESFLSENERLLLDCFLGRIYMDYEDYESSEMYLVRGYEKMKSKGYATKDISSWMAELYFAMEKYYKSLPYLKRTLEEDTNSYPVLVNIGLLSQKSHDYAEALKYLNKAILIGESKGKKMDYLYLGLGQVYESTGQFDLAEFNYKKVVEDSLANYSNSPFFNSTLGLVSIYCDQDKLELAKGYWQKFKLGKHDLESNILVNDLKVRILSLDGDIEGAMESMMVTLSLKDSLRDEIKEKFSTVSTSKMENIELVLSNMRFEEENATLERQKSMYQLIVLTSLLIMFVFLAVFLMARVKMQKKIREVKEKEFKLELRNKDLDLKNIAAGISIKKDFILDVKNRIKAINKNDVFEVKRDLKSIVIDLVSFGNIEGQMGVLFSDVNKINENYYSKLKEAHPELTQGELEICAYHVLSLNTKEIAMLRKVSPKAIQIARYRIKKKLKLEREVDLLGYLKGLA